MLFYRRCVASVAVFIFVLFASAAANNINNGGQVGVVRTISSKPLGLTGLNIGGSFKYDRDFNYVSGPGGVGEVIDKSTGLAVDGREAPQLISGDVYFGYGLFPNFDLAIDMPIYYDITGWDAARAGAGDLGLALKYAHPFRTKNAPFTNAYYLKFTFPTGQQDRGYFPRHAYYQINDGTTPGKNQYTAHAVLFNPMLLWTLDFTHVGKGFPLQLHGNIGGAVTTVKNSSAVIGACAMEYTPVKPLTIFVELSGEARVKYYTKSFSVRYFVNDPLILTPGIRLNFPFGLYTTIAGDFGLSSQDQDFRSTWDRGNYEYSTSPVPRYGAQISVGWAGIIKQPDTDKDGIIDIKDKCPDDPEDIDGFKDEDGCPDPDNDGDGIPDAADKCPNEKADCDGCPVYDTDNDGIVDEKDKCPKQAEEFDGFKDEDGCPALDNDGDGIPDAADKCPNEPEDKDGFEDDDGCPDRDNDGDGIADEFDKCPGAKGLAENEGCPKTKEIQRGKLILSGVNFQSGKAVLEPNSYRILDQVYESLAEWIEVKLEIQGYTDSQGNYDANKRLSQARAETVMQYLIQKGISSSRLRAMGFGEDGPIDDNNTAKGRARNRRVELNRID